MIALLHFGFDGFERRCRIKPHQLDCKPDTIAVVLEDSELMQKVDIFLVYAFPPQATNDQIWQYFNNLPPISLNHNMTLSGGNQFYTDYAAVLSQLQSNALTNFQNVLGSYYPMWQQYLATLNPFPSLQDLPNVFYQWAVVNAPTVAGPGRSAYAAALLDPIFAAQTAALNTNNFVNSVPNFTQGVTQLFQQIPSGAPVSINFDSATASSNVTNTWAKDNTGIFFGIFGESDSSTSQLSQQFASSRVAGTISFQKFITFVADPPACRQAGTLQRRCIRLLQQTQVARLGDREPIRTGKARLVQMATCNGSQRLLWWQTE